MAAPLLLGWHPVPTLGSLAEAVAVFGVAALLAFSPPPANLDLRRFWLGTGGLLGLLLFRCLMQPLFGASAYAGFWLGPFAVLATAFLVCCSWGQRVDDWLRVVAVAVLLASCVNAVVGFLQFWRIAVILDFLGPYVAYWDRADAVAHGNVAQRNILASLCLLGMAASLYIFPKRSARVIVLEAFLAYLVALSASRTPLAIVLAVVLMVLFRERHWRALGTPLVRWFVVPVLIAQLLAPVANVFVLGMLDLTPVASGVDRISTQGLGIRTVYYRLAAEIGMQKWLWGLGWKSVPVAMVEQGYRRQLWGSDELPTNAHNLLLQLWVENGLLLALLASCYPIWLILRSGLGGPKENFARLSLAVLIVHSWLEYPLWQPALLFLFVASMCVLESRQGLICKTGAASRVLVRLVAALLALGAAVTVVQFVLLAERWQALSSGQAQVAAAELVQLRANPVIEPYADWLALNMNMDAPGQRVVRLERLVSWLPDAMMLGLLAEAYRVAGRVEAARAVDDRRRVVFGLAPGE